MSCIASVGQHNQVLHVQKSMVEKKSDWEQYLRNLFIKKRQPAATHVFIFLLSDECRNKKPYCLPIQYVPYHSLKDQDVRELTKNIRLDMAKLGMLGIGLYIMFITQKKHPHSPPQNTIKNLKTSKNLKKKTRPLLKICESVMLTKYFFLFGLI